MIIKKIKKALTLLILTLSINLINASEWDVFIEMWENSDKSIVVKLYLDTWNRDLWVFNMEINYDKNKVTPNWQNTNNWLVLSENTKGYMFAVNPLNEKIIFAGMTTSNYVSWEKVHLLDIYFISNSKLSNLDFLEIKINELTDWKWESLKFIKNPNAFASQEANINLQNAKRSEQIKKTKLTKEQDIELRSWDIIYNNKDFLKNSFNSCNNVDNLLDKNYTSNFNTNLKDIENNKYSTLIKRLNKAWIVNWDANKNFNWDSWITRAELLAILLKSHCYDFSNSWDTELPFIDVNKDNWQYKVIAKAYSMWIVKWDINSNWDKIFRENDPVSRAEAIAMIMWMWVKNEPWKDKSWFTDLEADWQENILSHAIELNILENSNNKFNPQVSMTRNDFVNYMFSTIDLYR